MRPSQLRAGSPPKKKFLAKPENSKSWREALSLVAILFFLALRASQSNPKTSVACKQIASTTPQVWLVAGSHLGFAEKSFQVSQ